MASIHEVSEIMNTLNFSYLEKFINFENRDARSGCFHLGNMISLLNDFDNPQNSISFIHVAGSKGKGLTSAFLASLLARILGQKIGIYSSPHVYEYQERIRYATSSMKNYQAGFFCEDVYSEGLKTIRHYIETEEQKENWTQPTTFELLTLLALLIFRAEGLSWAVIEVGIGGRLDATNVIHPELSVLTPLEIEHSQYLGNTLAKIAWEKAGIIKSGRPVISQQQESEAAQVIRHRAAELKSDCYFLNEFKLGTQFLEGLNNMPVFMKDNACLAHAAVQLLVKKNTLPLSLDDREAAKIITNTTLPGRFEMRNLVSLKGKNKQLFLDAAHTPTSIKALFLALEAVLKADEGLTVIFSALKDKNSHEMLKTIISNCDNLIITGSGNFKRSSIDMLEQIATEISQETDSPPDLKRISDPCIALQHAMNCDDNNTIAICGSFYLLGEIYKTLEENYKQLS